MTPRIRAKYPTCQQKRDIEVQAMPATIRQWTAWILHGFEVWRSRRTLLELTEDQLRDIGLSSDEAFQEGRRPIWDRRTKYDWWR
ncbi:DUF1127 domain-containing protein [Brucella endophytica]|uniref:DUF1127 domain-containing protein n=1 Tax=Brucella endophytica TaxID=1963359 RepID=UPI00166B690D|nr:DUF1127 domain-containing protein [Brucella endophytica]